MSLGQGINIIKRPYTPRDILSENRYNIIIEFEARVHEKSYLLIEGADIHYAESNKIRKIGMRLADEIIEKDRLNRSVLQALLNKYKLAGEIIQKRSSIDISHMPIIPSSSLKGAIRSRLEYKFIIKNGSSYSCYSVIAMRFDREKAKRHISFWGEDISNIRQSCNLNISPDVCRVCDIFGAPGLSSRVDFSDALPISRVRLIPVEIFGTNYYVIPPGGRFKFDAICRNFNMEDLGLVLLAMEVYSNTPIIIGRFKYRYNPLVGGKYGDEYYFGLLHLKILNVRYVYPGWDYKDLSEVIKASREAIEHYVKDGYLDPDRGVIR